MTEIFNKAYNQANQILDGSGLSSVIHKQEGGSFNTYDRALEAWQKDATRGIDDMAIDTTAAFKHGGKITSGGLAEITKSININGQPHKLAWINSDEASALKAMGGSGKKVDGIPAYFWDSYTDAEAGVEDADSFQEVIAAVAEEALAAGEGEYMGTGEDVANESRSTDTSNYVDTVGPEEGGYSWDWMPSGKTWRYDYSTDPKAEGPGPGADDHMPWKDRSDDAKAWFKDRGKELEDWAGNDINDYKARVRAFGKARYGKDAQMKHMFDREAARVLDRLAVEFVLP